MCEALHVQQVGRGGRDKRRVGRGGYIGNPFEQFDIFGVLTEIEVAHQGAEGGAAKYAVFLFVHLLEHRALIELRRALEVPQQFLLAAVQDLDLKHDPGLGLIHQVLDAPPRALQLLERGMVHDFVQLNRDQVIDLGNPGIDHHLGVARDGHRAIEHLCHEFLNQVFSALS